MIGDDPIATYSFFLNIDGLTIAQFKEVKGLAIQVGVIEHRANMLKGQPVLKKLPGGVKYPDIVCSRGKINDESFWDWIKLVQEGNIDKARRNGTLLLYDYAHGEVCTFNFEGGWPSKVELGALSASADSVLLETVTITIEKLLVGR